MKRRLSFSYLAFASVYFLFTCVPFSYAQESLPTRNASGLRDALAKREIISAIKLSNPEAKDSLVALDSEALRDLMPKGSQFAGDKNVRHAEEPPPTNNADGCKDTLAEREIIQMSRPFRYEDLAVYKTEVDPVLKRMDHLLPQFGQALRRVMAKKWRFGFDQIETCPSEDAWFSDKSEKVACESQDWGVINPAWFYQLDTPCKKPQNGADKRDLVQKQKDTLLRELVLGLKLGKGVKSTQLAAVLSVITQTNPLATATDIETVLEINGFDGFSEESICVQKASNQDVVVPIQKQITVAQQAVAAISQTAQQCILYLVKSIGFYPSEAADECRRINNDKNGEQCIHYLVKTVGFYTREAADECRAIGNDQNVQQCIANMVKSAGFYTSEAAKTCKK